MKCTCENQNICPTYPRNLFYRMVERVLIHPLLILCFQIKGYMETAYVFYREQTLPHIAFKTYLLLVVKVIILSQDKFEDIKGIIRSRKRTDNAMAKSKRTNRQTMIYNTRCRKLMMGYWNPTKNRTLLFICYLCIVWMINLCCKLTDKGLITLIDLVFSLMIVDPNLTVEYTQKYQYDL